MTVFHLEPVHRLVRDIRRGGRMVFNRIPVAGRIGGGDKQDVQVFGPVVLHQMSQTRGDFHGLPDLGQEGATRDLECHFPGQDIEDLAGDPMIMWCFGTAGRQALFA
ncbi:hypothetical protein A9O63_19565 [Cereibacter johrii]|nr:hypothetical protein A9O63_19565 [Cereibacter johrii]